MFKVLQRCVAQPLKRAPFNRVPQMPAAYAMSVPKTSFIVTPSKVLLD